MAYARDDIQRVRDATNLVELFSAVTTVKKTGRSFKAICPFHQEKTPSMSIDPAKGVYHCFGCSAGGDVFTFLQETQGLAFNEAIETLAGSAGVTLRQDPDAAKRRSDRDRLVAAMDDAVAFYHERLKQGADAGAARAYLRGRGYDTETVGLFSLGYSPDAWEELVGALRRKGHEPKALIDAGLASRSRRGTLIDRFRNRLMFPIYDVRGDAVGFGARTLDGEGAKYLNTSETRLYHKARLLYGLNWAKAEVTRRGFALVVEGYTDVIAMHAAGFPVAVATCGTALGEDHFDLLRRFCDKVILAFDSDEAGAAAAERGDSLAMPANLSIDLRVAIMPDGKDPADLVQAGDVDVLMKAVEDSQPLLQYRIEQELARHDLSEPEAKARAMKAAAELIRRQPDDLARREYAAFVARRAGADLDSMIRLVSGRPQRRGTSTSTEEPSGVTEEAVPRAERELLRLLLDGEVEPGQVKREWFTATSSMAAFELVAEAPKGKTLQLATGQNGAAARLLRALAVEDRPLSDSGQLLDRFAERSVDREIELLRRKLQDADDQGDEETYSDVFAQLIALERTKHSD